MDRKSSYKRGRQGGHPENKSPYLIHRERKQDKWKSRIAAAIGGGVALVALVFFLNATGGQLDSSQTSVLLNTGEEIEDTNSGTVDFNIEDIDVDATKKELIKALDKYKDSCGENKNCKAEVDKLVSQVVEVRTGEDALRASNNVSELGLALSLQALYKLTHPTF